MTNRISSVAYAVDEIASDEKTASAIVLVMRWCSCSDVASGRPTKTRFSVSNTSLRPVTCANGWELATARLATDRTAERQYSADAVRQWYGTEMTTVPLRNRSRPFRNSALWLWRRCPHHVSRRTRG